MWLLVMVLVRVDVAVVLWDVDRVDVAVVVADIVNVVVAVVVWLVDLVDVALVECVVLSVLVAVVVWLVDMLVLCDVDRVVVRLDVGVDFGVVVTVVVWLVVLVDVALVVCVVLGVLVAVVVWLDDMLVLCDVDRVVVRVVVAVVVIEVVAEVVGVVIMQPENTPVWYSSIMAFRSWAVFKQSVSSRRKFRKQLVSWAVPPGLVNSLMPLLIAAAVCPHADAPTDSSTSPPSPVHAILVWLAGQVFRMAFNTPISLEQSVLLIKVVPYLLRHVSWPT